MLKPHINTLSTPRLLAFTVVLSIMLTALEWASGGPSLLEMLSKDVSVDMEMMPQLERNDMISVPVEEKKKQEESNRIRKVDELEMAELTPELEEAIRFVPLEGDAAADANELPEEVPPIVQDFSGNELPERVIEELPEYPGGYAELVKWMTSALRYPSAAQKTRLQGEVDVQFIIEKDGSVSSVKLAKSSAYELNQEVQRVIGMMPRWKPATNHGNPVRAMIMIPILFAL